MLIFNIDEFKRSPDRKLILRHYRKDKPEIWTVEEAQITIGNRLIIKVPETGYATDDYALVDEADVRDRDGNLVGTLEFATEEVTLEEFAERLFHLPFGDTVDFTCSPDGRECCFGATKIRQFDATLIIIAGYGGNKSFLFDETDETDSSGLCEKLRHDLHEYLGDCICIDLYSETELWEVTFQKKIEILRRELTRSIINILKGNGLKRLELSKNLENPTYVVWHEPQEGVFYDTPVLSVSIHGNGISLEVEESENGFMETLYSVHDDLACMHLDWLAGLRNDILETIELLQHAG